jgi:hypothetical protein
MWTLQTGSTVTLGNVDITDRLYHHIHSMPLATQFSICTVTSLVRLAFLIQRPLSDADCNLMILHWVRLSQGTELDTVTVLPEQHNKVYLVTATNTHVLTQLVHHEQ